MGNLQRLIADPATLKFIVAISGLTELFIIIHLIRRALTHHIDDPITHYRARSPDDRLVPADSLDKIGNARVLINLPT